MTKTAVIVFAVLSMAQANEPSSISGRVLDPDGRPVTTGTVMMMTTPNARVTASINRLGQFRVVPDAGQRQSLLISVPGFAPYRAYVSVSSSRRMVLPDIQLLKPTFFVAKFVTTNGEPIGGSIRRQSIDADGAVIQDPLEHLKERADASGAIMIGPLPLGRTVMAFDRTGWAQARVRDAVVNGSQELIDGGTITVGVGGTLHVDVVDDTGAVVPQHNVWLEDAVQPSVLFFSPLKTNAEGRADFTHLAQGRYRVWTQTIDRCGVTPMSVSRLVSSSGSGETQTRLVAGGRARLRITSSLGPLSAKTITISPDAPGQTPWQAPLSIAMAGRRSMIIPRSVSRCSGQTDADGRVSIQPFPPGPAEVLIPLINSTFITRVTFSERGPEIVINVPDGLIPVKAIDSASHGPIVAAQVVWTGGGGRAETTTNANGDALLEAPGEAGGTLRFSARDYETIEGAFAETPGTLQEVVMTRMPSDSATIRIESEDGKPVAGAVVMLSARPGDADEIAMTGTDGVARFLEVAPGSLRLAAAASGFLTAHQSIPAQDRATARVTLKPAP